VRPPPARCPRRAAGRFDLGQLDAGPRIIKLACRCAVMLRFALAVHPAKVAVTVDMPGGLPRMPRKGPRQERAFGEVRQVE